MNINDKITERINQFEKALIHQPDFEKKLVHFHSVQNISGRIIKYWGEKPTELKENLLEYLNEIEKREYSVNSKIESTQLYGKYILPIIQFLVKKDQFVTSGDIRLLIIIGGLVDSGFYFYLQNYLYPIFLILFFLVGSYRRKQAQRKNKYSKMFW